MPSLIDIRWNAPAWLSPHVEKQAAVLPVQDPAIQEFVAQFEQETNVAPRRTIAFTAAPPRISAWKIMARLAIALWLAGIVLLAIRILASSLRLGRAVARMKRIEDPRLVASLESCRRELLLETSFEFGLGTGQHTCGNLFTTHFE